MSGALVLDASAGLRIVGGGKESDELAQRVEEAALVIAPDLYAAEVANGLWRYASSGAVPVGEVDNLLHHALALVDRFLPAADLATEALHEALEHRHPVYDLIYAVTARRLGAAVLTRDRRLETLLRKLHVALA